MGICQWTCIQKQLHMLAQFVNTRNIYSQKLICVAKIFHRPPQIPSHVFEQECKIESLIFSSRIYCLIVNKIQTSDTASKALHLLNLEFQYAYQ